jgi:hypothetical protein
MIYQTLYKMIYSPLLIGETSERSGEEAPANGIGDEVIMPKHRPHPGLRPPLSHRRGEGTKAGRHGYPNTIEY